MKCLGKRLNDISKVFLRFNNNYTFQKKIFCSKQKTINFAAVLQDVLSPGQKVGRKVGTTQGAILLRGKGSGQPEYRKCRRK